MYCGCVYRVKGMMSAHVSLLGVQMTGYCTTWSGEGDAAAGTRQVATEIDFHTDIDEDGIELVSPHAPCHLTGFQDLQYCRSPEGQRPAAVLCMATLIHLSECPLQPVDRYVLLHACS